MLNTLPDRVFFANIQINRLVSYHYIKLLMTYFNLFRNAVRQTVRFR
jgi:hypothetical protein